MASAQNQAPNVDLFDAYFLRADLDHDGRISGTEAVSFFQGSGLPKQVLAQVILSPSLYRCTYWYVWVLCVFAYNLILVCGMDRIDYIIV